MMAVLSLTNSCELPASIQTTRVSVLNEHLMDLIQSKKYCSKGFGQDHLATLTVAQNAAQ
jgi:hypothetical protein